MLLLSNGLFQTIGLGYLTIYIEQCFLLPPSFVCSSWTEGEGHRKNLSTFLFLNIHENTLPNNGLIPNSYSKSLLSLSSSQMC